jgi:hypothetical protein
MCIKHENLIFYNSNFYFEKWNNKVKLKKKFYNIKFQKWNLQFKISRKNIFY